MVRPLPRRISSLKQYTTPPDVSKRDAFCISMGVVIGMILVSLSSGFGGAGGAGDGSSTALPQESHPPARGMRTMMTTDCTTTTPTTRTALPLGMNPIYVYYGRMDILTDSIPFQWWLENEPSHADRHGEWFAQHGQDVAVAKFHNFKRNGYFVDLAANDAVWASNTFSLEQNFDWNGICIEANNYYWFRLGSRKCQVVGTIVGGKDGDSVTVALGQGKAHGPYGGIVGDQFDNKQRKTSTKTVSEEGGPEKRYTLSLETILKTFDAPKVIDYLSLDVEGAESFILTDFPCTYCADIMMFIIDLYLILSVFMQQLKSIRSSP